MSFSPSGSVAAPTETLEIGNGLSLVPRVKLLLTIYRSDPSVKPIDEWQLKRALIDFLKDSFSVSVTVPEEDLDIRRFKDLKKRKREDPVASGTLYIRDLGFLSRKPNANNTNRKKENPRLGDNGDDEKDSRLLEERKFSEWKKSLVDRMDGMELNIEGVKFRLNIVVPPSDDFDGLRKAWEDFYAFQNRGQHHSRGGKKQPDTLVLRGVPSRWFAEPRVSSKPSMLVTHTIFSVFGKIRNLNVAEDDDLGKNTEESGDIVSGLQCKIVVQFEKYEHFYDALKLLCGRSLQKQGSRLRADYEATWQREDFSPNTRQRATRSEPQPVERHGQSQAMTAGSYIPRYQPRNAHLGPETAHPRRCKD
ncbi:uncharacterized protein LOC122662544 isoform X2 [Telopea speciosissima]|uniref:uncharacterized protein LOC122662544 isoform X2 n=1 Tax=Telopea speciosissima TaxID=54955 RepID=UPI001CC4E774|nr:uncharacterized protein LOC122662544 isoform X2 [Telopea speciosissima]